MSNFCASFYANVIFFLLLILTGWILFQTTHRKKLLGFFGLSETKAICVYLSNLRIPLGGSVDAAGRPRSYQGSAVPWNESFCAYRFQGLFNFLIPHISGQKGFLKYLRLADFSVSIEASPLDPGKINPYLPIISTGGPGYNVVSDWIQNNLSPIAKFDADNVGIQFPNLPPILDVSQCFVQRIKDKGHNRTVFYTAGISEPGTMGAITYLQNNWKKLHSKYGNEKDFCILLKINRTNFADATVVFEKDRP